MRIAILVESFGRFGGREQIAIIHALHLTKRGHKVVFFHNGIIIPPYWRKFLFQLQVRRLKFSTGLPSTLQTIKDTVHFFCSLKRFERIILYQAEPIISWLISITYPRKLIVYITCPFEVEWVERTFNRDYRDLSATFGSTAARNYGIFARLLNNDVFYIFAKKLACTLDTYFIHHCKRVVAVSKLMANQVQYFYRLKEQPTVVYAPLNPDLCEIAKGQLPRLDGTYVLAVGALVPEKNFELVIKAVNKAKLGIPLVIAGKGKHYSYLENLSRKLSVNTIFTYASDAHSLAKLYENALFVIQSSLYEALSLVSVEAGLFHKLTILANSRWNGATEQVLNGISGIVLEGNDVEKIAEAMKLLAKNMELRRQSGLNAHKLAQRFLPTYSTEELEKVIM